MAIIQSGSAAGTALLVDLSFAAARVTVRPSESLGWLSFSAQTGNLTGITATANVFSFRNLSANPILVRRLGVGFITTTAFTTAQTMSFALNFARAFTVSDSGGTALTLTGSNAKHRTSMATLTSVDARIATTVGLTAGTKTTDATDLATVAGWSAGQGVTITPALANLFSHDTGDYPLVIAQNEGFNIFNRTAMGAAGVGVAYLNVELAEASAF